MRVGQRRHQHIGAAHRGGKLVAGHPRVGIAQLHIEQFLHPGLDDLGQASRDDNTQACCGHGSPPSRFQIAPLDGKVTPSGARHKPCTRQRTGAGGAGGRNGQDDDSNGMDGPASGACADGRACPGRDAAPAPTGLAGRDRHPHPRTGPDGRAGHGADRRREARAAARSEPGQRDHAAPAALRLAEGQRGERAARAGPDPSHRLGLHAVGDAAADHRGIRALAAGRGQRGRRRLGELRRCSRACGPRS